MFTEFYADLYGQDDHTMNQAMYKLRQMKAKAMKDSTKIVCHSNELRDIGLSIFPNRVAGRDGLPSNVIRNLPYSAFMFVAQFSPKSPMRMTSSLAPALILGFVCL